eukprot:m.23333 g.23333  ORF g.23333 m.23333 type:complete len:421 (-) comp14177_c0_seq1:329-1591(-)
MSASHYSMEEFYTLGNSSGSGSAPSSGDTIEGAAIIIAAGILQGLFTAPMKLTKGFEWENHWLLYAMAGTLIMPWIIVIFTVPCSVPGYGTNDCPEQEHVFNTDIKNIGVPFGLGFLWGVGGVLFGLGCDMVGNSLGFSIILGLCSALGAAIPLVVQHSDQIGSKEGIFTWIGLGIVTVGLCFLGAAGIKKEKEQVSTGVDETSGLLNTDIHGYQIQSDDKPEGSTKKKKPSFMAGLLVCILSGVFSPMLNVAVNFGVPIENRATCLGANDTAAHNTNWGLIVTGGFVTQFGYSVYLLCKNGTWHRFCQGSIGTILRNWFLGSLMGILWFSGNVMYTVGAGKMGSLGTVAGWPMLMICMVLTANVVAVVTGEWKGTSFGTRTRLVVGLAILVLAAVVGQLGISTDSGNSTQLNCTAILSQ